MELARTQSPYKPTYACGPPYVRPKEPNSGIGPRGVPDCYYKSHQLESTFRYVKYIKKLRNYEEEQRKGHENHLKVVRDQQISDFFNRCDRRSLINGVSRRVDLCMRSYDEDFKLKKAKLKKQFEDEDQRDIRMFVEQAQAAQGIIWQEKLQRLQYLLDKRRKEHEEKYKDTPLSKAAHVLELIVKKRAEECQEIQLYQMKEKQARMMAEREFAKMWHEVSMKECEALNARMELDAMERYRRDMECTAHRDRIREQQNQKRDSDREKLRQETLALKAKFAADLQQEADEAEARRQKSKETARERKQANEDRAVLRAKQQADHDLIQNTWDLLAGQGQAEEQAKIELRRRRKVETNKCNVKLIEMRDALKSSKDDDLAMAEAKKQQDIIDRKRCDYALWSQKTNRDVRLAMIEQIKDRQKDREDLKKKMELQDQYQQGLFDQLQELLQYKAIEDAKIRQNHQKAILEQIEYNKILKERALQEERDQIKKGQIAAKEYEEEIQKMLKRPFYSDELHPFMKQMHYGLKMSEKCPCSKPDYCGKK